MQEKVRDIITALRGVVASLDGTQLHAREAMELVDLFADVERLGAAGRTLAADRVQQTRAWRGTGASSAAAWMADRTGTTLSHASATLNNAQRLKQLPGVRDAFLAGRLSQSQTTEITTAAVADRAAESELLAFAERENLAALREHCRDVISAAAGDEDVCERIRRGRYFRHWNDRDGAVRVDGRFAPDDAAPFIAAVRARAERFHRDARTAGQTEPMEAYAADAVVSLVDGAGAPKTVVYVHVSQAALERGHTVAGETCRIDGIGPISVTAARRLTSHGVVKVLETEGHDVRRVAHAGRVIPARLRSAIEARDTTCVVPGCNRRFGLEIDHVVPLSRGGETSYENLARLCRWHHAQKTHHGWHLYGSPGSWEWSRGPRPERPPPGG